MIVCCRICFCFGLYLASLKFIMSYSTGSWVNVPYPGICSTSNPLLLTDGSVIVFNSCKNTNGTMYKLTPDKNGNYATGKWSSILAPLPNNWSPLNFASAVLSTGDVIIAGGEFNLAGNFDSQKIAIYDPKENKWTKIKPPFEIDGSKSVVLSEGSFMLSDSTGMKGAKLNSTTLKWTLLNFTGKNSSKGISNKEEWTLLPDESVLSINCFVYGNQTGRKSQIYDPVSDSWKYSENTPFNLIDTDIFEAGASILRPDKTIFSSGSNSTTAIYDTILKTWKIGPKLPSPQDYGCSTQDAPVSLLPNGNLLISCSGGIGNSDEGYQNGPTYWYEFNGTDFIMQPKLEFHTDPAYVYQMLVLPNGEILQTSAFARTIDIFTAGNESRKINNSMRPIITSPISAVVAGSVNNKIYGKYINGRSLGSAYANSQTNSNFPLIRIRNNATGHVFYCRTHDHSFMGVSSEKEAFTFFDIPKRIETGASTLEVISAGIASLPISITVQIPSFSPTYAPSSNSKSNKISTGTIIGISIGGFTGFILIVIFVLNYFFWRKDPLIAQKKPLKRVY